MSSRVTNNNARVATPLAANNAASNTPAANAAATDATSNATVNTADAATFSSKDSFTLADLGRMVNTLEAQVKALEARVTALTGSSPSDGKGAQSADQPTANGGVQLPPGMKLPAFPGAQDATSNTATANTAPTANTPTPASNVPADNSATSNTAATNTAPTANSAAPTTNSAAPTANTSVTANSATPTSNSQIQEALKQLHALQAMVDKRVSEIEALLRNSPSDGKGTADKDALDRQQAGLQAVSQVLRDAKLTNLTPQEEAVVQPAVKRVHEIAQAIADGGTYNQYAAELFALHATLVDPAGAGNHKAVTAAAQLVGQINDEKTKVEAKMADLDQQLAAAPAAQKPALEKQKTDTQAYYKALVDEEKALDDAKLVRLSPEAEQKQIAAINQLGDVHDKLVGGSLSPADAETQIFTIGQGLKNPAGTSDSAAVASGAQVLKQIADAQTAIQGKLSAIDQKIAGGAAPEQFAGERAGLLESAESLNELGNVVKGAKLEQSSPAATREVQAGLQKSSEIASGLAKGDSPSKYRAETFVLKQTFQAPIDSKTNPAVQSGAGALQLLGRAEAANLKKQQDLAAQIAKGADPRTLDAEATRLHRQAEDLETIRHAIETPDYSGLNDAQEAQGAKLIDEVRDIGMKVANGEDFTKYQAKFDDLAKQLKNLKNFGDKGPADAPTPAPTKLEPGAVYQVKSGDYLTKIARERLGSSARFKDIVELNKDKYPSLLKNPDLIYPGWTLVLPKQ